MKAKLEDLCLFLNGLWTGKKPPYKEANVIRNTNFTKDGVLDDTDIARIRVEVKQFEKRELRYGDIILEKSGGGPKQPVGRVILFDKDEDGFSFSNFTSAIRIKDSNLLDFRFLHKYLHWIYVSGYTEKIQSHSIGIRNLDGGAYKNIEIEIPSLGEQRRIVAKLDEAFDGLARAQAIAAQNLQNAREVFESQLNAFFEKPSANWAETTIGAEIELLVGFAFKSTGYTKDEAGTRLLRGDNIIQGKIRWDDAKRWPAGKASEYLGFALRENDVVLAMDRPWVNAGLKRALISKIDIPCLLVQRTACLRAKPRLMSQFLYYIISSSKFISYILGEQTGIGVPHISGRQIEGFPFRLPPMPEQTRIVARLDALGAETRALETHYQRKLDALAELKKSLLHQAFSGEL